MIIYLLVRIRSIFIDGYEIGCEKDILNAYSTKKKRLQQSGNMTMKKTQRLIIVLLK